MKLTKILPPPVLFLLCLIAGSIAHYSHPLVLSDYPFRAGLAIGCAMLLIAVTIGGFAMREMRRMKTPIEPWKDPRHLVTTGPFRFSRNPLYVTVLLTSLAIAVMVNSSWLAGSAALLLVLLDRLIVTREEKILGQTFGGAYADYKAQVRRWL